MIDPSVLFQRRYLMSTLEGIALLAAPILALVVGGLVAAYWNPHEKEGNDD